MRSASLSTFPEDDQVENRQVGIHNAAPDRLALALSLSPGAIAGVAFTEQQTHTPVGQDALLHGEPLLVVSSTDAYYIALPFISKRLGTHLGGHALVKEGLQLVLTSTSMSFWLPTAG